MAFPVDAARQVLFFLALFVISNGSAFAFVRVAIAKEKWGLWGTMLPHPPASFDRERFVGRGAGLAAESTPGSAKSLSGNEVRVGFIGCGTIASAIATGLVKQRTFPASISKISVSKRSEMKSQALKDAFPELVTVEGDNQRIVDSSDIVFLCVLPQQEKEVISSLEFQDDKHTLVSLVATSKLEELTENSGLSCSNVYKMICLPPVAELEGTCLLVPKGNKVLKVMFESLGGCVECETESIMNALMIPGCLMGPMYGILKNNRDWLVQQGVPPEDASYFVGRQYQGIIRDAERNCSDPVHFDRLILEQTPGGLNEQALKNLAGQGIFEAYDEAMEAILGRIEGRSDGTVPPKKEA